eukprot:TRINITY_DN37430_c0_g1_i1.p1 TRINITY_DN37430_c0_g1~~TRINITY_DN37430_c0_g1_i1.p1  ORF type:complete len:200 (+),score=37.43 TRINITY_DN37430_c0_g1_i1:69-668(+)
MSSESLKDRVERIEKVLQENREKEDSFRTTVVGLLEDMKGGSGQSSFGQQGDLGERYPSLRLEPLFQIPSVLSEVVSSASGLESSRRLSLTSAPGPDDNKLKVVTYVHMAFDFDGNGYLGYSDARKMQELTEGTSLTETDWVNFCAYLDVDSNRGLDIGDLARMYSDPKLEACLTKDSEVARQLKSHDGDSAPSFQHPR